MTATAQACGAWCWQRSHESQTQGVVFCSSPSVGIGPGCMGGTVQNSDLALGLRMAQGAADMRDATVLRRIWPSGPRKGRSCFLQSHRQLYVIGEGDRQIAVGCGPDTRNIFGTGVRVVSDDESATAQTRLNQLENGEVKHFGTIE